jgi:hypothetical protein
MRGLLKTTLRDASHEHERRYRLPKPRKARRRIQINIPRFEFQVDGLQNFKSRRLV